MMETENQTYKEKIYIKLYKANWCGYCNRFMPDWEKLKQIVGRLHKELAKQNIKIKLKEYEETNPDDKIQIEKDGIKSYPTIRIIHKKYKIENNAKTEINDRSVVNIMKVIGGLISNENIKTQIEEIIGEQETIQKGGRKHRYYNEYLKCRAKYLKLKNKFYQ